MQLKINSMRVNTLEQCPHRLLRNTEITRQPQLARQKTVWEKGVRGKMAAVNTKESQVACSLVKINK
jgi:hypothetical protein